jgi:hypothetical protein
MQIGIRNDTRVVMCGYFADGHNGDFNVRSGWQSLKQSNEAFSSICPGGWGFTVALEKDGSLFCWGIPTGTEGSPGVCEFLLHSYSRYCRRCIVSSHHCKILEPSCSIQPFLFSLLSPGPRGIANRPMDILHTNTAGVEASLGINLCGYQFTSIAEQPVR